MDNFLERQYSLSQRIADKMSYQRDLVNGKWTMLKIGSLFGNKELVGELFFLYFNFCHL